MKIHIITVGEPKLSFAKEGFNFYVQRLSRFHDVYISHVRDDNRYEQKILDLTKKVNYTFACDEKGTSYTSREFSQKISTLGTQGNSSLAFLIGGPDGHTYAIKDRANQLFSLGSMTLPHDIAMLVLAESLYRAATIESGHPYHRN